MTTISSSPVLQGSTYSPLTAPGARIITPQAMTAPRYQSGNRPVTIQSGAIPGMNLSPVKTITAPTHSQDSTTPGTTTTGSTAASDPVAASYYGNQVDSLKALLGTLPTIQEQGVGNIRNSANKSLDRLNEGKSQTDSSIATSRLTADKNKATSLNGIDQNVSDTVGSFRRLLGAAHAGNSAFANEFVPMATAKEGSQQRQQVFDSYGQDMGNLDTAAKNSDTAYKQNQDDINEKLNSDILSYITSIQNQRDTVNDQAKQAEFYRAEAAGGTPASLTSAIAPYTTDAAKASAALQALFAQYANPNYAVNPVSVKVPDLTNYTRDPLVASLSAANPDTPTSLLPFLPQIKKQFATV